MIVVTTMLTVHVEAATSPRPPIGVKPPPGRQPPPKPPVPPVHYWTDASDQPPPPHVTSTYAQFLDLLRGYQRIPLRGRPSFEAWLQMNGIRNPIQYAQMLAYYRWYVRYGAVR